MLAKMNENAALVFFRNRNDLSISRNISNLPRIVS